MGLQNSHQIQSNSFKYERLNTSFVYVADFCPLLGLQTGQQRADLLPVATAGP